MRPISLRAPAAGSSTADGVDAVRPSNRPRLPSHGLHCDNTSLPRFIDDLRKSREAVEYLELTLDSLLMLVRLPEDKRPHFVRLLMRALDLESTNQRLAIPLFGASERQVTCPPSGKKCCLRR